MIENRAPYFSFKQLNNLNSSQQDGAANQETMLQEIQQADNKIKQYLSQMIEERQQNTKFLHDSFEKLALSNSKSIFSEGEKSQRKSSFNRSSSYNKTNQQNNPNAATNQAKGQECYQKDRKTFKMIDFDDTLELQTTQDFNRLSSRGPLISDEKRELQRPFNEFGEEEAMNNTSALLNPTAVKFEYNEDIDVSNLSQEEDNNVSVRTDDLLNSDEQDDFDKDQNPKVVADAKWKIKENNKYQSFSNQSEFSQFNNELPQQEKINKQKFTKKAPRVFGGGSLESLSGLLQTLNSHTPKEEINSQGNPIELSTDSIEFGENLVYDRQTVNFQVKNLLSSPTTVEFYFEGDPKQIFSITQQGIIGNNDESNIIVLQSLETKIINLSCYSESQREENVQLLFRVSNQFCSILSIGASFSLPKLTVPPNQCYKSLSNQTTHFQVNYEKNQFGQYDLEFYNSGKQILLHFEVFKSRDTKHNQDLQIFCYPTSNIIKQAEKQKLKITVTDQLNKFNDYSFAIVASIGNSNISYIFKIIIA